MLTVDLDRLGLRRDDWLLDAGCGGGRHCFGALDRGVHTVGLDLDVASLNLPPGSILPLFATLGLVDDRLRPKLALSVWDSLFAISRRP